MSARSIVDIEPRNLSAQDLLGLALLGLVVLLALDLLRMLVTGDVSPGRVRAVFWNGIVDSLYIGLAAIGLAMTYSILRFANFSHGDLITAGAFSGWSVAYVIGGLGVAEVSSRFLLQIDGGDINMDILNATIPILVGFVAAALFTIGIALLIDRLVYKRMRDAGGISLLIASVGVAFVLRYAISIFYGANPGIIPASAPTAMGVNLHELTLVVISAVLILGVHLLLQYTKLGKSMRAMSDNRDLALITGIPTERVITYTWIIGAGLAGSAGFLLALDGLRVEINMGWFLLLLIFAAVILGGIGSIYGALAGAFIIGLTINLSHLWLPSDLDRIAAFVLMIIVLVYKPEGLFGGVETA